MFARRLLFASMFLFFVADSDTMYGQKWIAPLGWLHAFFFAELPHRIRPLDHLLVLAIIVAPAGADGRFGRVAPMRKALLVAFGTIALWFIIGLARGGDARAASWQTYLITSGILFAFALAAVCRTAEHFATAGKLLLAASAYRAVMCWLYYFTQVRGTWPSPEYMTSHDDTIIWVVSVLLLTLHIIDVPTFRQRVGPALFAGFLLGAVQFNQRRLAWVSLAMGLVVMFALLPRGRAKRRIVRTAMWAAPVLALYVGIGWGRKERIFKPVESLTTITTREDASTKARNVEDLGLIFTANHSSRYFGTGWGHKYIELSTKYQIHGFELWPYVPHDSILGLLAYTGILGFAGYWLAFPTAMFLNARVAARGQPALARRIGAIGAMQMVVCANQMIGDMGTFAPKSVYVLAASYAIALRLPVIAGVWPSGAKKNALAVAPGTTGRPPTANG